MIQTASFAQFRERPLPGVKWLVHGLIPKPGRFLLVGGPKAGKSNLALQIALAVSQGKDFLGSHVTKGRVLFLQFDASDFEWKDRFDSLYEAGVDLSGDNHIILPKDLHKPFDSVNMDSQNWLTSVIAQVNPDLVILDVLREMHSADEDSSTEMKIACTPLFHILRNQAVLILHHTTKLQEGVDSDPIKAARGTGYLSGAMTAIGLLHNGKLRVKSRLSRELEATGKLNDIGLWEFEADSSANQLITQRLKAIARAHPTLPRAALYNTLVKGKFNVTKEEFVRRVGTPSVALAPTHTDVQIVPCTPWPA